MGMLIPAVRSWFKAEALWRYRAIAITIAQPTMSDAVYAAMQKQRALLDLEAAELAQACDDTSKSPGHRGRIASNLRDAIRLIAAEPPTFPVDVISPKFFAVPTTGGSVGGLGKLGALGEVGGRAAMFGRISREFEKAVTRLLKLSTVAGGAGLGYLAYKTFLQSQADRTRENIEINRVLLEEKKRDIAACRTAADPEACMKDVEDLYGAIMPSSCDILDTPLGSVLGLLAGAGLGYVGIRKIMGIA